LYLALFLLSHYMQYGETEEWDNLEYLQHSLATGRMKSTGLDPLYFHISITLK